MIIDGNDNDKVYVPKLLLPNGDTLMIKKNLLHEMYVQVIWC